MSGWRDDAIGAALRGENPMVMARMRSGFAVIGDTQFIPGYALLLTDDPAVSQLSDLDWERRSQFLLDMSLLGEAVGIACRSEAFRRVNYALMGNDWAVLHAHVHPRYGWEPEELQRMPVWRYPLHNWQEHAYDDAQHGNLRAVITSELERLMAAAYGPLEHRSETP